jgi:DNA-directed RNA polymerase specialized sigma24 family protein
MNKDTTTFTEQLDTTTEKGFYVSNKKLTADLTEWVKARKQAIANNEPLPRLPESVGEAALMMSHRISLKFNFVHYTFRDEMVSDAVVAIVSYAHNFNPDRSQNAFAYFTQIINNAYIRRIQKEQKQTVVKASVTRELSARQDGFTTQEDDASPKYRNTLIEFMDDRASDLDIIKKFEDKKEVKKNKLTVWRQKAANAMTIQSVAKRLGKTVDEVQALGDQGKIEIVRCGGNNRRYVTLEALQAFHDGVSLPLTDRECVI